MIYELLFASLAADNANVFYQSLVAYLAHALGCSMRLVDDVPWPERERRLYSGEAHLGVVCGLQYVHSRERRDKPGVELLAAAVMRGKRYQDRPIYYSDVVVRRESPALTFADLRGARWAYNEQTSHSGYNVTRFTLAQLGLCARFFGLAIESGTHQRSLDWIVDGTINAAAIDATVLEQELRLRPALAGQLRVLTTLCASPIPPLVASRTLPKQIRTQIRQLLVRMHADPAAARVLLAGSVRRFVSVVDSDYDPIRRMARLADTVQLT